MVYFRITLCFLICCFLGCFGCSSTSVSRISVIYKPNVEQQVQIDVNLDSVY